MTRTLALSLAAILTLATPAAAQEVTVDRSFQANSLSWTGGLSGRFV